MSVSEPLIQSVLLGDAVERAPVAVLVADEELRYVAANEYACALLGYSREELLRMRTPEVSGAGWAPDEIEKMDAGGELDGVTRVTRKDGSEVTLRYRASETDIAGLPYYISVSWPEP